VDPKPVSFITYTKLGGVDSGGVKNQGEALENKTGIVSGA
jgi:hypothetical protein